VEKEARVVNTAKLQPGSEHGTFFLPRAYEIPSIKLLTHEVFGPALHVVRWKSDELDDVIDAINGTGFGLTLGVHSRIDATVEGDGEAKLRNVCSARSRHIARNLLPKS
jgi:RHH-type proline utilization regulon transcriptional repressor/proline dehydrogenase/delta 1-pyrroline-5-carboxylate dehydrogenase